MEQELKRAVGVIDRELMVLDAMMDFGDGQGCSDEILNQLIDRVVSNTSIVFKTTIRTLLETAKKNAQALASGRNK